MKQILIVPPGSVLPDGFPLEKKMIADFGDLFKLEINEETVLEMLPRTLDSYVKVIDELPYTFANVVGVPGGLYDVAWDQASYHFPQISFSVMMEEWSKAPAEKSAVAIVSRSELPDRNEKGYRRDAPELGDLPEV